MAVEPSVHRARRRPLHAGPTSCCSRSPPSSGPSTRTRPAPGSTTRRGGCSASPRFPAQDRALLARRGARARAAGSSPSRARTRRSCAWTGCCSGAAAHPLCVAALGVELLRRAGVPAAGVLVAHPLVRRPHRRRSATVLLDARLDGLRRAVARRACGATAGTRWRSACSPGWPSASPALDRREPGAPRAGAAARAPGRRGGRARAAARPRRLRPGLAISAQAARRRRRPSAISAGECVVNESRSVARCPAGRRRTGSRGRTRRRARARARAAPRRPSRRAAAPRRTCRRRGGCASSRAGARRASPAISASRRGP